MINEKLLTVGKPINESDLPCPEELLTKATYKRTLIGAREESSAVWETGLFCIGLQYRLPSGRPYSCNGKVSLIEAFTIYEDGTVTLDESTVTIDLDSLTQPSSRYDNTYFKITNNKTGVSLIHNSIRNYQYSASQNDLSNSVGVLDINGGTVEFTVETAFQ